MQHVIPLNLYTRNAQVIIKRLVGEERQHTSSFTGFVKEIVNNIYPSDFVRLSSGEVAFDLGDFETPSVGLSWRSKMYANKQDTKRVIAKLMIKATRRLMKRTEITVNGFLKSGDADDSLNFFYLIDDKKQEFNVSLREICYIIETLNGEPNVDAKYGASVVDRIKGVPADPFVTSTIQTMMNEIEDAEKNKRAEIKAFEEECSKKMTELRNKWNAIITEKKETLKEFRLSRD